MLKRKILIISLLSILFVAIYHFFALKNSWYWTYRWSDIPVHIVGGFGVSLGVLWVCLKIRHIDNIYGYKKKSLLAMMVSVLIVAVLWEVYELIFKITSINEIGYWKDSLADVFNSLIGGLVAYLYFIRNKKVTHHIIEKNIINNLGLVV